MADDAILRSIERIEAHVAVSTEIMHQNNVVIAEIRQEMTDVRQEMADVRFEQRQWSLRGERVMQGMLAELAAGRAEHLEGRRVLAELRADIRAQTQGLLALIDEMRGGGPAAAGA